MGGDKEKTWLKVVPLGDGLYQIGNDIYCAYPLVAEVKNSENEFTYEYEKYYIKVTADGTGDERHNIHWQRIYKEVV